LSKHVGHNICNGDFGIFCGVVDVRQFLRKIEVTAMLDTVVSLAVCIGLLIYLVYAMLRPEKF